MKVRKLMRAIVMVVLGVGMLSGTNSASFKDCYTKCFIFCMIEPSQTLCSCTTHCLKDCIFPEIQNDVRDDSDSLGFCKLGCAFSKCSTFSSKHTPNGEKVDNCVGSCSNKCTKTYSSP
ncbi:hypothetical protein C2S52_001040 [Perilla frutescens var. hirtella]|uniref:Thionin-like protein 2 n=1 Tax=Perilla frutescens var. hirtella TaxID=608512 RepID=A0AAD4NZ14_PERFH|nr:hypothetical protein C2S51_007434 [Perilla frutescens var. frutescens]KAH6800576.1 hypothetical protein C2S52_001040 [Perilla frutescens var. hirtella]KAH6820958.1 hypothetical protein C2S53_018413 [Perilla frutescens var. hirtella]